MGSLCHVLISLAYCTIQVVKSAATATTLYHGRASLGDRHDTLGGSYFLSRGRMARQLHHRVLQRGNILTFQTQGNVLY